jgi:hypothetical protein
MSEFSTTQSTQTYGQPYGPIDLIVAPSYPLKIRKVKNGWVLMRDNREYVFNAGSDLVQYIGQYVDEDTV